MTNALNVIASGTTNAFAHSANQAKTNSPDTAFINTFISQTGGLDTQFLGTALGKLSLTDPNLAAAIKTEISPALVTLGSVAQGDFERTFNAVQVQGLSKESIGELPYSHRQSDQVDIINTKQSYEKDVHLHLTETIAVAAGFSNDIATQIAKATQGVDDNPSTSPMGMSPIGNAVEIREKYHFTTQARRNEMYKTFLKSGSPKDLGIYLHALQDSYSHAGFGARFGHLSAGHAPDKTYNDVNKADRMAKRVFDILVSAKQTINDAKGKNPVSYDDIESLIKDFNRVDNNEKYVALSYIDEVVNKNND